MPELNHEKLTRFGNSCQCCAVRRAKSDVCIYFFSDMVSWILCGTVPPNKTSFL